MEERYALALALREADDRFIFALRRPEQREYSNRWSIPSITLTELEFRSVVEHLNSPASLLDAHRLERLGISLPTELALARRCIRYRQDYVLHLALVTARATGCRSSSDKYSSIEALPIGVALTRMCGRVGSCVSLLIEEIYETGVADFSQHVLELPPELADSQRPLETYRQTELWALCARNYHALLSGAAGSDGHLKRELALSPAIAQFVQSLRPGSRIVDLGCGDGQLVSVLRAMGHEATGLDTNPPPFEADRPRCEHVLTGRIEDLPRYYGKESLDVAILSLVCQWMEDIGSVATDLSRCLAPRGRLLVVLVAPEFAKIGYWEFRQGAPRFVITEGLRQGAFLTMINRGVGPLWCYQRSIPEYIRAFGSSGLCCVDAQYVFLDTFLTEPTVAALLSDRPYLMSNVMLPCFLLLEFAPTTRAT